MPKTKKANGPVASPESPRKTPKKDQFSSPRKADRASSRTGSRDRQGQSPSPVRRPKPKFNLDKEPTAAAKSVDDYLDRMPESPPVFEGLVKLKEQRSKKVKAEVDDRIKEEPLTRESSRSRKGKVKVEAGKGKVKTEPSVTLDPPAIDSPHKIYLKKDRKKKTEKNSKQKTKKRTKKVSVDDDVTYNGGSKITDFFDVRRSSRKPAKQIENERTALWRKLIREECIDGLEVRDVPLKGRGVFNSKHFQKDDFVVEYAGDLIDPKEAEIRDEKYSNDSKYGSYMYYFIHKGTKWCIDATIESGKIGRLLNHSCKVANCATKVIEVNNIPRLVIYAKQEIATGTELLYDYGDRGKVSLEAHPWLKE